VGLSVTATYFRVGGGRSHSASITASSTRVVTQLSILRRRLTLDASGTMDMEVLRVVPVETVLTRSVINCSLNAPLFHGENGKQGELGSCTCARADSMSVT